MAIATRVIMQKNVTNQFLLFNILVDNAIAYIGQKLSVINKVNILEPCQFIRNHNAKEFSPILVTSLGSLLPPQINRWFSVQRICQFADHPRQYTKCYKFNHIEMQI